MKIKDFCLDIKSIDDSGTFEGYGSIFGNVDSYGDIVQKGAFIKSLAKNKAENRKFPILWQHDSWSPIGVWDDLKEDNNGLYGRGELNLNVRKGLEAYHLMKQGALTGLSIGYREVKVKRGAEVTILEEVDLYEISPVTFPANPESRIVGVKSDKLAEFALNLRNGTPLSAKEFENILREAGIPKALATQIVSVGYAKAIRSESDGKDQKLLESLKKLQQAIKG